MNFGWIWGGCTKLDKKWEMRGYAMIKCKHLDQGLLQEIYSLKETHADEPEDEATEDRDLTKLKSMMENGNFQEAFFYARRLVAQGENWAEEWMSKAKDSL